MTFRSLPVFWPSLNKGAIFLFFVNKVLLHKKRHLSIPSNNKEALQAAFERKSNKLPYLHLTSDLESKGFSTMYTTLEIGLLGHWPKHTIKTLSLIPNISSKIATRILLKLSKTSVACSYHIFNSHQCTNEDQNKSFYFSLTSIYLHIYFIPCQALSFSRVTLCPRLIL